MVACFHRKFGPRQQLELNITFFPFTALFLIVLSSSGCGGKHDRESSTLPSSATAPPTAVVDPTTTGAVTGTVFLDGTPPFLPPINMSAEPACAEAHSSEAVSQPVVVGDNGALANVVVYVNSSGLAHDRFDPPKDSVVLDQKGCMYEPRVVALMTNQPLEFRNSDATIHNVHAMPKANHQWNKAQRAGSATLVTSFSRPELAIPFMCNVHPWMRAFVSVFDHPYYAVTTREGKFELKNLPPGTYTVEAWHEKFGKQSQQVALGPRESKEIWFRFNSGSAGN